MRRFPMMRAYVLLFSFLASTTSLSAQTSDQTAPDPAALAAECRRLLDTPPKSLKSYEEFVKLNKQALEACRRANAAAPDDPAIKVALARALRTDGQLPAAVLLLKSAADAGSIEALYPLVEIHLFVDRGDVKKRPFVTRAEAEAALRKAAEAGQPDAMLQLALLSERGGVVRRDPAAARFWAERAAADPPKRISPEAAQAILGRLLVASDAPVDRTRGFALLEKLVAENVAVARTFLARGLRGERRDLARARALLEQSLAERDANAVAPLAEMLINGEGGAKDVRRGLGLLRNRSYDTNPMVRYVLSRLLLEGKVVRRDPAAAAALLADHGVHHFETRVEAMKLLATYTSVRVRTPGPFLYAAMEAAELGEPGAAAALMELKFSRNSQFRDEAGGYDIARMAARRGDDVAAVRVLEFDARRARSTTPEELQRIRAELARLTGKNIPQAFTLQGKLLRVGGVFPQDDVAATRAIVRGAELGDIEAMLLSAKAYDDGLGLPKDVRQQVRWLREAAKRGSVEARRSLIWEFSFDSARQITLREAVTELVALYNERLGNVSTTDFIGGLSGMRIREFTARRIAAAIMDGFRLAPAGLSDERLVPLIRQLPQELRGKIEKVLKAEGFYSGDTEGYFGPEARAALGKWVDAKGPLTGDTPADSSAPPQQQTVARSQPVGPSGARPAAAIPSVPPDVLDAYWARTRDTFKAAKTDRQRREVVRRLALLARAGDMSARWLIVRDYDNSGLIRAAVTPVEAVRWGLDVLLTKPPFAEKASIEFAFLAANLGMSRKMAAFGEAFMIAARDDPRLAADGTLAGLMREMIFIGGACESIGNQLRKLKAPAYDTRDECGPSMREAIQAVVKAQGPAGVDLAARTTAVKEITQPAKPKGPRKR